jgi:hypothetical protein
MPRPFLRECLLAAAKAGGASGHGAAARRHAARVLWQLNPSAEEARAARLAVIDSYVAGRQGDAAYLAMLRFQQDYAPLDRATAERFVDALLALDMEKQAVNWLANLDDASSAKLMLRLKAGLVGADAAIAQARSLLTKGGTVRYWGVIAEAAQRQKDGAQRVEALEHLLNVTGESAAGKSAPVATELWEAYLAAAQDAVNRNHMLIGDDAALADFAARGLASSAPAARAIFAQLAQRGRARESRFNAQLQLAYSLQEARLERTALRLFDALQWDESGLDAQARYLLGAMAEKANQPALAIRFWKGLALPPGINAGEWQVRLAAVYWRGGMGDAAVSTLRGLLEAGKPLPPEAMREATTVAREMLAAGKLEYAEEVLRGLLPVSDAKQQRDILYALGRIAEQGARYQPAADYYLRSALLVDGKVPDALALQARLAAGINLVQAGYREDARAQFRWLLKNATDPAQIDIARRELSKL